MPPMRMSPGSYQVCGIAIGSFTGHERRLGTGDPTILGSMGDARISSTKSPAILMATLPSKTDSLASVYNLIIHITGSG